MPLRISRLPFGRRVANIDRCTTRSQRRYGRADLNARFAGSSSAHGRNRVLGGVAREVLLEEGAVREGNLLADVSGPLYCLNSIRGIETVVELDGRPLRSDAKLRSRLDGVLARRSEFRYEIGGKERGYNGVLRRARSSGSKVVVVATTGPIISTQPQQSGLQYLGSSERRG